MRLIFIKVGTTCRIQSWSGDTFTSLAQLISMGVARP